MLAGVTRQSLWIDEWFTVQNVAGPWETVLPKLIAEERRPPLYWILLKTWSELAGHSEFALRLLSIAFAATTVTMLWRLGRRLLGSDAAGLAAAAFALSPFVLLFGSMVRSYMLFTAATVFSVLMWLRCTRRPTGAAWAAYAVVLALLLYIDYGAIAVVAAHGAWWLARLALHRDRRAWLGLGALAAAAATFSPWMVVLIGQSARSIGGLAADLASSPLGVLLKFGMPFVSLAVGETLYPWTPLGVVGVLLPNAAAAYGSWRLWRRGGFAASFLLTWIAAALTFTATLLSLVAVDITFLNAASRAPHLAAAFALLVAYGAVQLPVRIRYASIAAMVVVWGAAFANYFTRQEFLNPIYAVPTREVAAQLRQAPDDALIVAESDTLAPYYYRTNPGAAELIEVRPNDALLEIQAHIERRSPSQVHLVWFGRDRTAVGFATPTLSAWLQEHGYREVRRDEHGAVGASYRAIKTRLFGRETYTHKLTVQVFERVAAYRNP